MTTRAATTPPFSRARSSGIGKGHRKDDLSYSEATEVTDSIFSGLDPDSLHRYPQCRVLNDTNVLAELRRSWGVDLCTDLSWLPDVRPITLAAIGASAPATPYRWDLVEELGMYPDVSFDEPQGHEAEAGWAITIVASMLDGTWQYWGSLGGKVLLEQVGPYLNAWLGAEKLSAYAAELTAATWGALWILQSGCTVPVRFYIDNKSAAQVLFGDAVPATEKRLTKVGRAAVALVKATCGANHEHVRGHSDQP